MDVTVYQQHLKIESCGDLYAALIKKSQEKLGIWPKVPNSDMFENMFRENDKIDPHDIMTYYQNIWYTHSWVKKEIDNLENIFDNKNKQLQRLKEQLQQIKYQKKEESEISTSTKVSNTHYNDSETGRVYSDDHLPLHLKLKQKCIDRKKLIANALIFVSRISHQLQKYSFLPNEGKMPDVVTDGYILDILSRCGMSLDLIIIKSIMTPVSKSKNMYDPEDIGIEEAIYVKNRDILD